jgi:hypothetical protein
VINQECVNYNRLIINNLFLSLTSLWIFNHEQTLQVNSTFNFVHVLINWLRRARLDLQDGVVLSMVFNVTINILSVISWLSVLLVEETAVPGENQRSFASHWQTLSHNVHLATNGFELNDVVVIGIGCTGSCNYKTITTTTVPLAIMFVGLIINNLFLSLTSLWIFNHEQTLQVNSTFNFVHVLINWLRRARDQFICVYMKLKVF